MTSSKAETLTQYETLKIARNANTDGKINKLVMVFALLLLP